MKKQARDALWQALMKLKHHLVLNSLQAPSGLAWPQQDGRVFHLSEPWAQELKDVAARFSRSERWNERFTDRYIRNCLSLTLIHCHDHGEESAIRLLDGFISMLEGYAVERVVYVPISGLALEVEKLRLGRVTFKRFNDQLLGDLSTRIYHFSDQWTESEPRRQADGFLSSARKHLYGTICAEFRVVAEPDRAIERAQEEARRATELIILACVAIFPPEAPQANVIVGLDGETPKQGPWILSVAQDEVNAHHSAPVSAMPIVIDTESLVEFERVGVMALSELLNRPAHRLSDWEESLLRAVHWLATSQAQAELENRLLNLTTAIEALLTGGSGGITAGVAESMALLLGRSLEERKQIKKFVRDMYGARSGVSHGGKRAVTESDVWRLRQLVASLLVTLVHRKDEFTSKKQVQSWLEDKRLSFS